MRPKKNCFTAEYLRGILSYDPETGIFSRLANSTNGAARIRKEVGHKNTSGYIVIKICDKQYTAAHLAWLYMTGRWPVELIDHINSVRSDNRWVNLREATCSQNASYAKRQSQTGYRGIGLSHGRWIASISFQGNRRHIGSFGTKEEAAAAYDATAAKLYGEFAILNGAE